MSKTTSKHAILVIKKPDKVKKDSMYIHRVTEDDGSAAGEITFFDHNVDFADCYFKVPASKSEKLAYACASLCGGAFTDHDKPIKYADDSKVVKYYNEILDIVHELYPDAKYLRFSSYSDYRRFDDEHQNPDGVPAGFIGMVPADSAGLLENFLKDEGITLRDFITNPRYIVFVDTKYGWLDKFKANNIVDESLIEKEYRLEK